ncbi:hypothetical protein SLEP1_g22821 [Rubroshorea leprosula]|uniref:Uncharacterized protein n=1 Tax=Rubroshorea leprosula TaxID=152421 RepID=A0AAV5JAC6_9ROSI|nr:hypothetical protein SLEP1_g22821 [Rubroshorea leprosula]
MVSCGRDLPRRLGGSVALLQTDLGLAFSIHRADLCGSVSSSAAGEQQMRMARKKAGRLGGFSSNVQNNSSRVCVAPLFLPSSIYIYISRI